MIPTLRDELCAYLDTLTITSETIGDLRRRLFMPWDSAWNGIVRDETAARENRRRAAPVAGETPPTEFQELQEEIRASATQWASQQTKYRGLLRINITFESRSPDGDGHKVSGVGSVETYKREQRAAEIQADAAGSEPADSHHPQSAGEDTPRLRALFNEPDSPDGSTVHIVVFREDDGRFFAEFQSGGEAGHGPYATTSLGAVANLLQLLTEIESVGGEAAVPAPHPQEPR